VEDALSERCIEGSGIFLIWADRPIIMNSVLEGLRIITRVMYTYDELYSTVGGKTLLECSLSAQYLMLGITA